MFGVGPLELAVLALVMLLLFGNRLPSVMRSMGRGVIEFKKGVQGIEDDVEQSASNKKDSETKKETV